MMNITSHLRSSHVSFVIRSYYINKYIGTEMTYLQKQVGHRSGWQFQGGTRTCFKKRLAYGSPGWARLAHRSRSTCKKKATQERIWSHPGKRGHNQVSKVRKKNVSEALVVVDRSVCAVLLATSFGVHLHSYFENIILFLLPKQGLCSLKPYKK